MFKARVFVTLKKGVLDPQGNATLKSLHALEYKSVEEVKVGKLIILKLNASNEEAATKEVEEMCQKLLYNPVIEEYSFEIFKEV